MLELSQLIPCILYPPKAHFHELALLCYKRVNECKLPDLDMDSSIQAEVEANAEKKNWKKLEEKNDLE